MTHEQAHLKMMLLLVKDWDGFQTAMRTCMLKNKNFQNDQSKECIQ